MTRGGYKINRITSTEVSGDRVDWLDRYAEQLQAASKAPKTVVDQARARDQSIMDQINNLVNRYAPKTTVEARVQEYQEKIGLKAYLTKVHAAQAEATAKAAAAIVQASISEESQLPETFVSLPENVKDSVTLFIRNRCESHHGNLQVPALVEEISRTFKQDGVTPQMVNDPLFEKFISDQILEVKRMYPQTDGFTQNIGKAIAPDTSNADIGNTDFFSGLVSHK